MILVCMRLDDMHRIHPKQDNSRSCIRCGHQVGIYPSGQEALARDPTLDIICPHCLPGWRNSFVLAPGAENEPFESMRVKKGKRNA